MKNQNEKEKRAVRPHKGGRTMRFPEARITPTERAQLMLICKHLKISVADWAARHIARDTKRMTKSNIVPN